MSTRLHTEALRLKLENLLNDFEGIAAICNGLKERQSLQAAKSESTSIRKALVKLREIEVLLINHETRHDELKEKFDKVGE